MLYKDWINLCLLDLTHGSLRIDPMTYFKNCPRFYKDKHSDKVSWRLDQNCAFQSVHIVNLRIELMTLFLTQPGAPAAQWVKRWPTDLADRVQSSLEVKSSQP